MIELKERLFTDEIKRLVPVLGTETSERLSRAYLIGDETTRKRIIEMLDMVKAAVFSDPELKDSLLLEPPSIEEGAEIGEILYGKKPVGKLALSEETFMTHVGIFGSSGYGKTNLSYTIIKGLSEMGVPVIVFDFSKKNYRDMLQCMKNIDVYTVGGCIANLRFNPLRPPPGVSKTQWAKEFAEIFDHAYWLLGGGQHIILKALSALYEEMDSPVLADLKKRIESMSAATTREKNWAATSLRPLESLCMKETGDVFMSDGIKPSSFFQKGRVTVLEMDALSTNDKTFFIEIMMQWIRDWLVASGTREKLQAVIVLEEAHHVLNREKSRRIGSETVMDLVFREMRELGVGVVYLDQHPSMVSFPALGNTSTHIYMNLGLDTRYTSDVEDASNMLGLDDDKDYLRRLPVGHAFVLMRYSKWRKPFAARFSHFGIKKGMITDKDVGALMKNIPATGPEYKSETDEMKMEIVEAIGSGKGVFTSQLYSGLKLSGSTFKEKIQSLIRSGIVGTRAVRVDKTRANYYFLTDYGEKIFRENFPDRANSGREFSSESIMAVMKGMGWNFKDDGTAECGGKSVKIKILAKLNREEILNSIDSGCYYLCRTPEIRNILLQFAAKKANSDKMKISIATFDEFTKKGFEEYVL